MTTPQPKDSAKEKEKRRKALQERLTWGPGDITVTPPPEPKK